MGPVRTLLLLVALATVRGFDQGSSWNPAPLPSQPTFRAAVYDKPPVFAPPGARVLTRREALALVDPVLVEYEQQAGDAAQKGARIIVFPEYGLYPLDVSRTTVQPFLEPIPHPRDESNPCVTSANNATYIQRRLSCIARNSSLYVVVNMGDVIPCNNHTGASCRGGRYQYNTNVVFDPQGKLVARYHKKNLFFESQFDTPNTVDYSYFDTPFGRFGTFTCFDVLFEEPAVKLIEQYGIDHVAFTTAWMNVLPYFSAVPFHQSFAIGQGVNFLSANIHYPASRFSGSGIYAGNGTVTFYNDESSGIKGQLLVGDLPTTPAKIPRRRGQFPKKFKPKEAEFQADVFGDMYNFISLERVQDDVGVCYDNLCCSLSYNMDASRSRPNASELFVLGAFRGLHTKEGNYFIEVCAFIKCASRLNSSCGRPVKHSQTHFSSFGLIGNFTTPYVYPQVTTENMDPTAGQWDYDGWELTSAGTDKPFVGAMFFARRYDLDPLESHLTDISSIGYSVASRWTLLVYISVILVLDSSYAAMDFSEAI